MIKVYSVCFFIFYLSLPIVAQNSIDWVATLGDFGEEYASKIVIDKQSNVYGVGSFQGAINSLTSKGNSDIMVFKYSPTGSLLWLTQLGSVGEDLGNDIAIDDNGNLYVTGYYRNGYLYYNTDSISNVGSSDAFVAKLDTQGQILWVKGIGMSRNELGSAISCDHLNNVYVVGTFQDSLRIDNQLLQSYGVLNNFIIKLDDTGSLIWHNSLSTQSLDNIQDVELDGNGNVYVAGHFRDIVYGALGQMLANGNNKALLAKFDSNGQLLWWEKYGGALTTFGFSIHLDNDYLYYVGMFEDTASFGVQTLVSEGEFDAFLMQCDTQGTVNWVEQIGGSDDSKPFDLASRANGNICFVGYFDGLAQAGGDSITSRNPRHDPSDIFIAEYSANGAAVSLDRIGGKMIDYATGIAISDSNDVYITGIYRDSVYFDSTLLISNLSSTDAFVFKYSKNPTISVVVLDGQILKGRIYPNPAGPSAFVEFDLTRASNLKVLLYNQLGQEIEELFNCKSCVGKQNLVFDTRKIPSGNYYIQIKTRREQIVLPIIVSH
jgi:hypothetical protein